MRIVHALTNIHTHQHSVYAVPKLDKTNIIKESVKFKVVNLPLLKSAETDFSAELLI